MRRVLAVALVALAWPTLAAAPKEKPVKAQAGPQKASRLVALRNPGFEDAPRAGDRCAVGWGCTMHADPDSFRFTVETTPKPAEGKQSLCVQSVTREPWALATQAVQAAELRGRRLRFSVALRIESADGAGMGPWMLVHGPQGNLAHEERPVKTTQGWERHTLEFTVAPTAQLVEVGATILGGGRFCLDDARLEVMEP